METKNIIQETIGALKKLDATIIKEHTMCFHEIHHIGEGFGIVEIQLRSIINKLEKLQKKHKRNE